MNKTILRGVLVALALAGLSAPVLAQQGNGPDRERRGPGQGQGNAPAAPAPGQPIPLTPQPQSPRPRPTVAAPSRPAPPVQAPRGAAAPQATPGFRPGAAPPPGGRGPGPSFRGAGGPGPGGRDFHGRDFRQFSPQDRALWQGGAWRHDYHDGRFGWWWLAGGVWYFYDQPVYPYPNYVPQPVYQAAPDYPPPPVYQAPPSWYYCDDPPGYYPYVQTCTMEWRGVASAPPGGAP